MWKDTLSLPTEGGGAPRGKAGGERVEVEIVKSDKRLSEYDANEAFCRCEQTEISMFGVSTYNVFNEEGFNHNIWICPVTLFVLGEYPKFIYIKNKN